MRLLRTGRVIAQQFNCGDGSPISALPITTHERFAEFPEERITEVPKRRPFAQGRYTSNIIMLGRSALRSHPFSLL